MPFPKRLSPTLIVALVLALLVVPAFLAGRHAEPAPQTAEPPQESASVDPVPNDAQPTRLFAHNILLRKGPHFRVYVRWIRGVMQRSGKRNPSLDAPESFVLEIQKGIISVKLADIADFLNNDGAAKAPLHDITLANEDGQLRLHGTVHKVVSLPVRLDGTLAPLPDGRLRYHLDKLNVMKVPMKGLLGLFHVSIADLMPNTPLPGVTIQGNDVYFDTQRLLPPPHIRGNITSVTLTGDQLTVRYGGANNDEQSLAQWHNFLRLVGGTLDFGKLTMRQADLTMIDASDGPWFDLDLANYQAQLIYGTTRITQQAGIEVYMPNVANLPAKAAPAGVTLQWLRDRNTTPPMDVQKK